ncbi:MAG: DUF4381 domain-containing protein [Pseudomonadota bacterium]
MMEVPYQYLRDIRGLDPIGWWPPAPGWWLVSMLAVLLLLTAIWLWQERRRFGGGWRQDAIQRLKVLRYRSTIEDPKDVGDELSELLRRIAIARRGRRACAGLSGETWLQWLSREDPTGFNWRTRGRVLLTLPYAPPQSETNRDELKGLIEAALRWVIATAKADTMHPDQS